MHATSILSTALAFAASALAGNVASHPYPLFVTTPMKHDVATVGVPLSITWLPGPGGDIPAVNVGLMGTYQGGDFHWCGYIGLGLDNTGSTVWDVKEPTATATAIAPWACRGWDHVEVNETSATAWVVRVEDAADPEYMMFSPPFLIRRDSSE